MNLLLSDLSQYNEAVEFAKNLFSMLAILGGGFWAVNKMWLSTIYQTKKDSESSFEKLQNELHNHTMVTSKDVQRIERENEVFKAQYKGDMDLLKLQMQTQQELIKDVLHKVNNIANFKWDAIIKMHVDDELDKRKI